MLSLNTQTVLAGACIGLLVYYVIKKMRYRLPPGPWCIPLIGHFSGNRIYTCSITSECSEYVTVCFFFKRYDWIFICYFLASRSKFKQYLDNKSVIINDVFKSNWTFAFLFVSSTETNSSELFWSKLFVCCPSLALSSFSSSSLESIKQWWCHNAYLETLGQYQSKVWRKKHSLVKGSQVYFRWRVMSF